MDNAKQLALESESLKQTIAKSISAWNKQLADAGHLQRYELHLNFMNADDIAEAKSDSFIKLDVPSVLGKTPTEKGVIQLKSFKTTIPSQKKVLVCYEHTFVPSNFLEGMRDADYQNCTVILCQKLLVEAFGVYLETLNKLVK